MEQKLPSSELYSHPNKLLEEHLVGSANLSRIFCNEKSIKLFDKKILSDVLQIIALTHDIGKSNNYFQEYLLLLKEQKNKYDKRKEARHSLLSAVCGYFLVKDYLNSKNINEWFLPFISFLVIKRHHGNISEVIDEIILSENDISLLREQVKNIDINKFEVLTKAIGKEIAINDMYNWVGRISGELKNIKKEIRRLKDSEDIANYLKINFLYSLLLDADKSEVVINKKEIFNRNNFLSAELIDKFKKQTKREKSSINCLREEAYQEVLNKQIDLSKRIYSINLPTGLGKTLTSLAFALKLREKLYLEGGFCPRIIYSLPFLSIIDQTSSVFEKILTANNIGITSNVLLKHHHLCEVFYKNENNEMESDSAKILIEGWNSEIIVTTFIQLFHTLISNKNKSLRKFHRLANSIIILDEIQSIPIKYWLLCKEMLKSISEHFNSYIIFVTATEPLIFGRGEIFQLSNREKYFKKLNRVTIFPNLEEDLTIEEFLETLKIEENKSYLFIFNTIENSAKKFYNLFKKKITNEDITYLSTHIIPNERLKRIKDIQNRKYKIVVSTQLVEAGVDIDFDIVYRDIAPLDSIIQSTGRCNRNNRMHGNVFIVSLKDDNGRKFASYIYDPILLNITFELLKKHKTIKEQDFLYLIDEYYKETSQKMSSDTSREILKAIYSLKYDSINGTPSIEHFTLIEQDYTGFDVFVEFDDKAKDIWSEYRKIKKIQDIFERKKKFDNIKPEFYQYVISIPQKCENIPPEIDGFKYVPQNCLKDYYDAETGYISKCGSVIW
ncbi:MAG: CRISPR-associated helicase Cas3' [Candidatus Omnitrophica bacterium]|nr:CRISPR-associated helicase Cas3' [Candidatus Omnitrophota bacterium]